MNCFRFFYKILLLSALCTTIFKFRVFISRNNSYVTKRIPMPFWVMGAWSIPASEISAVKNWEMAD
jgi:hypothetical protein